MNYLLPYHRIIYISVLLIFSITFSSAQLGDSLPPNQPIVPQAQVPTLAKAMENAPNDISKYALASYYAYEPVVQQNNIERKYFTDNAFDIGAYDNPFALQGNKSSKNRANKKKAQNTSSIFSDLFAVNAKDKNEQRIPKWLVFVLLGIVSFMTILVTLYRRTVGNTFQAFFSLGTASNLYREQRSFLKIESFSSYILFVLSMGTFCFVLPQFLAEEAPFNTFGGLLLCILGVGSIYILKHIQLQVVGLLLPYGNEIGFYSFIISITNKVIGYFLIPALFLLAYVPEEGQFYVLYFILSILGLIYIYRSIRGLAIGANTILFHKFHFFVYLCSVEIAPVIILLKLLSIF